MVGVQVVGRVEAPSFVAVAALSPALGVDLVGSVPDPEVAGAVASLLLVLAVVFASTGLAGF